MVCGWLLDDGSMRKCRVPIAREFHKWLGGSWPVDFKPSHPKKGDLGERSVGRSFEHSGQKVIALLLCTETLFGILRLRNPMGIVRRIGMIYRRGNLCLAVGVRLP